MRKHLKKIISSVIFSLMVITGVAFSEYFPDIIVTSPNGAWTDTRAYSSINSALSAIGANARDIYILRQEVTSNLTIPATARLHFMRSGSIANTGQLTINTKDINAGNYRIFTGVGNIDFASGSVVKSGWFNNFETALALTVNDTVTIQVTDSATLTGSYNLGNNVSLKWDSPGNVLTVNAGVTIGNIMDIEAGEYLIMTGAGNFRFRDGTKLKLSWFNHVRSAITYISTSRVNLTSSIPSTVDYSDTIPSTVTMQVNNGGALTISTGNTLTINASFNAGDHPAFICVGTGKVLGLTLTKSIWFNTTGDGVADDRLPMQQAFESVADGGKLIVNKGSYKIINAVGVGATSVLQRANAVANGTLYPLTVSANNVTVEIAGDLAATTLLEDLINVTGTNVNIIGKGGSLTGCGTFLDTNSMDTTEQWNPSLLH
ncbi:MAG: hypothetical protein WC479_12710, partial [Candidatus Izemoplasmatales bacterium]